MATQGPLTKAHLDQALAWHLRLRDADHEDWQKFTDWLASDPVNNAAYEEVVARDEAAEQVIDYSILAVPHHPIAANDTDSGFTGTRPLWQWGALAASIALFALFALQFVGGSSPYSVITQPGETQVIALADGGEITVNGASEIVLDPDAPRFAELRSGEAYFTINHDESNPFVVEVGDNRLVDIGTEFNVVLDKGELRVAVAEGAVRYEGREKVDLTAGQALRRSPSGEIAVTSRDTAVVGGWRDGSLLYDGVPLAQVAADLERATGVSVTLGQGLEARQFSGLIQTTGSREDMRQRLEQVLGLTVEESNSGWTLRP